MASEIQKLGISTEDLQATVLTWKRANDQAGTMARLTAKVNEVVMRANGTAYIFTGKDAAEVFLPILESAEVNGLFVTPPERKAYGANLHIVREVLGKTQARPRTTSGKAEGSVSTGKGKTEVERIDADIARLEERLLKLDAERAKVQDNIFHLTDIRPNAVKRDEEAKAAKEAQKKADEEAQAAQLAEVASMTDADIEAAIAAEKAKLELFRKALMAKRAATVTA